MLSVLYLIIAIAIAITAALWAFLIVREWAPRAERRGGLWFLEAMLYALPVSIIASTLSATTLDSTAELVSRATLIAVAGCAAFGTAAALHRPRRGAALLIAAAVAYVLAVGASAAFGAVPSLPWGYLLTPLLLAPFLLHDRFSSDWLLATASRVMRVIAVASLAAPSIVETAFWLEDGRTLFGIPRLAGVLQHPNGLAAVMAVSLTVEFARRSRWWWKAPIVVALILAQSTTGYAAAAFGVLILMATRYRLALWLSWLATAGMVGLAILSPTTLDRWASADGVDTLSGRTRVWAAALEGFHMNPVFGYGPSLFDEQYRADHIGGAEFATHAHNQAVQTLAENGIIGLTGLILLMGALVLYAIRVRAMASGVTLALLGILLTRFITETPMKPTGYGVSWFALALVVGLATAQMRELPHPAPASKRPEVRRRQREAASFGRGS